MFTDVKRHSEFELQQLIILPMPILYPSHPSHRMNIATHMQDSLELIGFLNIYQGRTREHCKVKVF